MKRKRYIKQICALSLLTLFGASGASLRASEEIKSTTNEWIAPEHNALQQAKPSNEITLKGNITDTQNEPLTGVSLKVKGDNTGTITDIDGNFQLKTTPNAVLIISYIGFATQEVAVNGKSEINIVLKEDTNDLDEVVVIGYGTVKKKDLTGSVAAIKGEDIVSRKTTNLSSALQGAVSGVMVRRNSNEPGAGASSILIRGVTTIGDSSPLVIVDGVPSSMDYVNPNDVESISVLKDAASASIYGSRAAGGVILITTKRAGSTDLTLTYNGEFGLEIPTRQPEYVGVTRYLEMSNELRYNDTPTGGFFQSFTSNQVKNWMTNNATDPNNYPVTDWNDLILKGSAPRQTHSVHISGGNQSVKTKASLSYDKVDGLYADRYYQRYMLRLNNDFTINKVLSAKLDLNIRRAKNHNPIYDPFAVMRNMPAIYAATWDDGRIAEGKSGGNPYGLLTMGGNKDAWSTQIGGKGSLEFKPIKGLNISANVAPFINYTKTKEFKRKAYYTLASDPNVFGAYLDEGGNKWDTNKLTEERNDDYNVTSQLIGNYMTSIGSHDITAMVGFENYYTKEEKLGAARDQYILTNYPYLNLGSKDYRDNSGTASDYTYNSYFGRLIYGYDNKYLFQANIRRDGSSRFDKDHRWGTFPSFSAGWIASEENFVKNLNWNWLSFAKVKASWGQLGNERIGDNYFPYMSLLTFGNSLFYQNGNLVSNQTAAQRKLAVKDLTWETTESTNIGVDLAFLKNRLRFSGEYYWKKTKDMLLETQIPLFMGYANPYTNAGKMKTKGFDIELGWNDRAGDWSYGVSVNLSDFLSELEDLNGTRTIKEGKIKEVGSYFNEWYGYLSDGLILTQEDLDNCPKLTGQEKIGDIKYKNIGGDENVINQDDMVKLGNSLPRYQYGGTINVGFKDFDLSMAFQGIGKQLVRMDPAMIQPLRNNYGNIPVEYEKSYWSAYNTDEQNAKAKYPRLSYSSSSSNYAVSDFWLFNGRYFRLKNLTIGYTLPKALTQKASINKLRIYASGSDLFCISKFPKGWDPEMGVSAYPITTSLVFGLSVNF